MCECLCVYMEECVYVSEGSFRGVVCRMLLTTEREEVRSAVAVFLSVAVAACVGP